MIIDSQLQLSAAQAITVSAASTNYLDQGAARDLGPTEGLYLCLTVKSTFTAGGAATLAVELQTDSQTNFATEVGIIDSRVYALADLVAGKQYFIPFGPSGVVKQYIQAQYNVATGPFTAGTIDAQIVKGIQQSTQYTDGPIA